MSKRNLGRKRKREERTGWCRRASLSTSLSLWGGLGIAEFSKMCVFLQARQSQSLMSSAPFPLAHLVLAAAATTKRKALRQIDD